MVIFFHTQARLELSQIEDLEKFSGLKFPESYKNHLLKYNGGQCDPKTFNFIENGERTQSNINWFLAIDDDEDESFRVYFNDYKIDEKRLPNHILPIAHDSFGNLICISCGRKDYGYVYFWDHENGVDYQVSGDDDYSNLYLIADDFDKFIDGLV
jgi:hypothetical protein